MKTSGLNTLVSNCREEGGVVKAEVGFVNLSKSIKKGGLFYKKT